jgi:hypothetical protein
VQLVFFGCGLDAITTDEVRRILEKGNKIYTQIKSMRLQPRGGKDQAEEPLCGGRQKEANKLDVEPIAMSYGGDEENL